MLARQDCNKREELWAVGSAERDERISRLKTIYEKQAHATMEIIKMQNEMIKAPYTRERGVVVNSGFWMSS